MKNKILFLLFSFFLNGSILFADDLKISAKNIILDKNKNTSVFENQVSVVTKEGDNIEISFDGDEIISLLLPAKTVLKVTQTDPGHKGNTATNALKPAFLETGLEVQVPLFINEGDLVKIDTKDGSYSERVKE